MWCSSFVGKLLFWKITNASISSGNLERPNSSLTLQELKLICIIKHKPPHRGGRWNQITIIFYYATGSHFFLAFFHFRGVSQQHPEMAKAQQATIQTLWSFRQWLFWLFFEKNWLKNLFIYQKLSILVF